jgi:hypothetical protein
MLARPMHQLPKQPRPDDEAPALVIERLAFRDRSFDGSRQTRSASIASASA